jgi:hypothetical protein
MQAGLKDPGSLKKMIFFALFIRRFGFGFQPRSLVFTNPALDRLENEFKPVDNIPVNGTVNGNRNT